MVRRVPSWCHSNGRAWQGCGGRAWQGSGGRVGQRSGGRDTIVSELGVGGCFVVVNILLLFRWSCALLACLQKSTTPQWIAANEAKVWAGRQTQGYDAAQGWSLRPNRRRCCGLGEVKEGPGPVDEEDVPDGGEGAVPANRVHQKEVPEVSKECFTTFNPNLKEAIKPASGDWKNMEQYRHFPSSAAPPHLPRLPRRPWPTVWLTMLLWTKRRRLFRRFLSARP